MKWDQCFDSKLAFVISKTSASVHFWTSLEIELLQLSGKRQVRCAVPTAFQCWSQTKTQKQRCSKLWWLLAIDYDRSLLFHSMMNIEPGTGASVMLHLKMKKAGVQAVSIILKQMSLATLLDSSFVDELEYGIFTEERKIPFKTLDVYRCSLFLRHLPIEECRLVKTWGIGKRDSFLYLKDQKSIRL